MAKRVVITGIGTVNPLGSNVAEFFQNLDRGVSGARLINCFDTTLFKTKFACQIPDYAPERFPEAMLVMNLGIKKGLNRGFPLSK